MIFISLLELVGDDPVFESSLLLAGNVDPKLIRLQLTRWVKSNHILQLRRGLYCIAPPYQKTKPHPFFVANHLQHASYVSSQSALAYYGLIPETVNIITSVTTGRPERLDTPLGTFEYRHLKTNLFFGFRMIEMGEQSAFVATPEKALLDLIYLHPGGESTAYLNELRLQTTQRLDQDLLLKQAEKFDSPKMNKAVKRIVQVIVEEKEDYEDL